MPEIVYPLQLAIPRLSLFSVLCLVSALSASTVLLIVGAVRAHLLMRLSLIVGALLHVFFQWPLFILSNEIEASLQNKYLYFAAVQVSVFALLAFGWMTDRQQRRQREETKTTIGLPQVVLPAVLGLMLLVVYLYAVPFNCTALFAVLFDPEVTLVARELSIKLSGSYVAAVSYGAIANAVGPVVVALSIASLYSALTGRQWLRALASFGLIFVTVAICLLSGAKGLVLPTMIVVLLSSMLWCRTLLLKAIAVTASAAVLLASLVVFEVVRDRAGDESGAYQFGKCAVRLGACDESAKLIDSLFEREKSLGLSQERREALRKERNASCVVVHPESAIASRPNPASQAPEAVGEALGAQSDAAVREYGPCGEAGCASVLQTAKGYLYGIANRALVMPAQVGAWYYLYVTEEQNPGLVAIPVLRRFIPGSLNMTEAVYQKYGSVYSGGDRTSTSTAPTTFLIAYPAYLGWIGIVLAVGLVFITDGLVAALISRVPATLRPICVGLTVVIALNFILSDFATVMTSHGGFAAIVMIGFFAATNGLKLMKKH